MLSNFLKIAFRNLWKNKGIAAINIFGLSVGLACFALFLLYGLNEFSYDRFHAKSDRLYNVFHGRGAMNGRPAEKNNFLPMPLGPALQADLPDVAQVVRIQTVGEAFVRTPKGVTKEDIRFADATFFEMFSFRALYGNATTGLKGTNQVVLTKKMAQKLFGEANPTGKTLEIKLEEAFETFIVSAVTENVPSNSSVRYEVLLPMEKYATTERGRASQARWHRFSMQTFVELRPGSGLLADTARMAQFMLKYLPDDEKEVRAEGRWSGAERPFSFGFTPIRDLHHDADFGISPMLTYILFGIGGIVLLIACINFTTLAIGRSVGRAREVGVRKVIGASRAQLSRQFLTEAMLLSAFSTVLGLVLAKSLLPLFNQLADKQLSFNFQQFPALWALIPALIVAVGVLSGIYPALVLSGFSILETLKSKVKIGGENWFTRSLVTFQFVLSVGLVACTLVMLRQLDFLRTKNPGFNRENVVVVNAEGCSDAERIFQRFQQSLNQSPEVLGVSGAELLLGAEAGWSVSGFEYQGQHKSIYEYYIDQHYLSVLGLDLLAGRNFDPSVTADSVTSVILNETAVRDFGWTVASAPGQVLTGYDEDNPARNPVVVGVVRDHHFRSLHQQVEPMMFHHFKDYAPMQFFVRIAPGNPEVALGQLRTAWANSEPTLPFRYVFLDENIQRFYAPEAKLSKIIGLGGGIAVLLACLGLLGLASLSTVNRTKEIGIRKVLGASVAGIAGLLAKDFLKLVLLAIVIASPIAYYFMQRWLSDFAYRIDMQWWMFAVAGVLAIAIAFLTVGAQAVRAALANPVKSLRNE